MRLPIPSWVIELNDPDLERAWRALDDWEVERRPPKPQRAAPAPAPASKTNGIAAWIMDHPGCFTSADLADAFGITRDCAARHARRYAELVARTRDGYIWRSPQRNNRGAE